MGEKKVAIKGETADVSRVAGRREAGSRVVCLSFGQSVAGHAPCPASPFASSAEQLNDKRNCLKRLGGIGEGSRMGVLAGIGLRMIWWHGACPTKCCHLPKAAAKSPGCESLSVTSAASGFFSSFFLLAINFAYVTTLVYISARYSSSRTLLQDDGTTASGRAEASNLRQRAFA